MIQELTLIGTFFGIVVALCLMFMPTLIELKRPKDAGPRLILESFGILSAPVTVAPPPIALIDLEPEGQIIITYERLLYFLPNLESASE